PSSTTGVIIKHEYYGLSYSEEHEQAEWVAYELTRDRLNNNMVKRANNFRPDPKIETGSATIYDYKRSGYDRGHMVPAGDMAFSSRSMSQTFYMSNMSPQLRNFNGGIWRELEENVRDWARRFRHLYIVSGPILTDRLPEHIGDNRVSVPKRYFKVILDVSEPELKGIAYIMPNETSSRPIDDYAVSIDEVEAQTGIDFFHHLLDDDKETVLESQSDPSLWRYDQ
ncbi:MAG: DNA/RNA non-specific endonuclease, partial [Bacteroidota bacterium]